MAYDGDPTTSWIADPRDREPTASVDLGRVRTMSSISVQQPAQIAEAPTLAVISAGAETRTVDLQ